MSAKVAIFLILLSAVTLADSHPVDAGLTSRNSQEMTDDVDTKSPVDTLTDWNRTAGGAKWLHNCDFPGHDIKFQWMPIEKCHIKCCSQACIALSGCNAFRWNDGWCFLKNVPASTSLIRTPVSSGTCGFLPWELHQ